MSGELRDAQRDISLIKSKQARRSISRRSLPGKRQGLADTYMNQPEVVLEQGVVVPRTLFLALDQLFLNIVDEA